MTSGALPPSYDVDRVHHRPTRFYTLRRLAELAVHAVGLDVFQGFLDKRELQRASEPTVFGNDLPAERISVDYIADTGDGFNATYSVFHALNPTSHVAFGDDLDYQGHGDILIFGGDQVYPVPTPEAYEQRLTHPLADAVPDTPTGHALTVLNHKSLFESAKGIELTDENRDSVAKAFRDLDQDLSEVWPGIERGSRKWLEVRQRAVADVLEGMLAARHVFDATLLFDALADVEDLPEPFGQPSFCEDVEDTLYQRMKAPASLDLLLAYEIWCSATAAGQLRQMTDDKSSLRKRGRHGEARSKWKQAFKQDDIARCMKKVRRHVQAFAENDPTHPRTREYETWKREAWLRWMSAEHNFQSPGFARPWLFAIPGNHDWYDGLTAFSRQFMQTGRQIGAWTTRQERSYWAIQLRMGPYGSGTEHVPEEEIRRWWLWGIDLSLDSYIDEPQLEYFRNLKIGKDEPIILFAATPAWTYSDREARSLYYFERKVILERGRRLAMVVAGDRHYYMRREAPRNEHGFVRRQTPIRLTAGLGGSYTHPTHLEQNLRDVWDLSAKSNPEETHPRRGDTHLRPNDAARYQTIASYPSAAQSKRMMSLRRAIAAFFRYNRGFAFIPGLLCAFAASLLIITTDQWSSGARDPWKLAYREIVRNSFLGWPVIVLFLLFVGSWIAAEPDPGATHGLAQRAGWSLLLGVSATLTLFFAIWLAANVVEAKPLEWTNDWFDQFARVKGVSTVVDGAADGLADGCLECELWRGELSDWRRGNNLMWLVILSGIFGGLLLTMLMLVFFRITALAGMSVNALAAWNLEQRYKGSVRLTFTSKELVVTAMGIDQVPSTHERKNWRRSTKVGGSRSIRPIWDPTFPDITSNRVFSGVRRLVSAETETGTVPRTIDRFVISYDEEGEPSDDEEPEGGGT